MFHVYSFCHVLATTNYQNNIWLSTVTLAMIGLFMFLLLDRCYFLFPAWSCWVTSVCCFSWGRSSWIVCIGSPSGRGQLDGKSGFEYQDPICGGKGMTLKAGYIGVGLFLLRDLRGCVSEAMQWKLTWLNQAYTHGPSWTWGLSPVLFVANVDSRHNTVLKCISPSMGWVDLRYFSKPMSGAQATAVALHQRVAKDATPAGSAMLGLLGKNQSV